MSDEVQPEVQPHLLRIDRVVLGWKPADSADAALSWVLQRIDRLGASLTLMAVFDEHRETDAAKAAEIRAGIEETATRVRGQHPDTVVEVDVRSGDPAKELAAASGPGTLVVVGTDRRRGLSMKYAFSFGTKLAARAHGPIALIPHGEEVRGSGVIVGVDGSPAAIAAARLAAQIAVSRGDGLTVAHVWQEPTPWQDAYLPPDDAFLDSLQKVHQEVLDESVAQFSDDFAGLPITRTLVHGLAPWGLLDLATDGSLLVVGNHGLRGIQRFLLGSVSHTILLNLEGPTIVVPQH